MRDEAPTQQNFKERCAALELRCASPLEPSRKKYTVREPRGLGVTHLRAPPRAGRAPASRT